MKGLLLKEWYILRSIGRMHLALLCLFLVLSCLDVTNLFVVYYPCVFIAMLVVSMVSYDERDKWNAFAKTLPCTDKAVVSVKYITGLCLGALVVVSELLARGIALWLASAFSFAALAALTSALIPLAILPTAIMLPFIFKLGVEKGRLLYYAVLILFCVLIAAAEKLQLTALLSGRLWLLPAATLVLLFASWMLSVRFYVRREIR